MKISKNIQKKDDKKLAQLENGAIFRIIRENQPEFDEKTFMVLEESKHSVKILDFDELKCFHYSGQEKVVEYEAELKIYGVKE